MGSIAPIEQADKNGDEAVQDESNRERAGME